MVSWRRGGRPVAGSIARSLVAAADAPPSSSLASSLERGMATAKADPTTSARFCRRKRAESRCVCALRRRRSARQATGARERTRRASQCLRLDRARRNGQDSSRSRAVTVAVSSSFRPLTVGTLPDKLQSPGDRWADARAESSARSLAAAVLRSATPLRPDCTARCDRWVGSVLRERRARRFAHRALGGHCVLRERRARRFAHRSATMSRKGPTPAQARNIEYIEVRDRKSARYLRASSQVSPCFCRSLALGMKLSTTCERS